MAFERDSLNLQLTQPLTLKKEMLNSAQLDIKKEVGTTLPQ